MRKLLLFSLPFALGALLCRYLLPGLWRIAAVMALLAAGAAATRFVRRRYRKPVRIAAAGLALGMLWFSGYSAVFLSPAEALAGTEGTVRIELLDYAVETDAGARCTVRVLDKGLRGKAVYYGSAKLLRWEPGDRVRTESAFYSASHLAGGDSAYFTAQGIFARLYGEKETLITGGRAGSLRYLPQRLSRSLRDTAAAIYAPEAAESCYSGAHGRQVHQKRDACQVLQDNAGYRKRNFIGTGIVGIPGGQVVHVLFSHFQAVAIAEQGFQNDPDGNGKAVQAGIAVFRQGWQ